MMCLVVCYHDCLHILFPFLFVLFFGEQALVMDPIKKAYDENVLNIYKGKAKFLVSALEGSSAAVLGASAVGWDIQD